MGRRRKDAPGDDGLRDRECRSKPEPLYQQKKYPCRICGKMTKNRFFCTEHHRIVSESSTDYSVGCSVSFAYDGKDGGQE